MPCLLWWFVYFLKNITTTIVIIRMHMCTLCWLHHKEKLQKLLLFCLNVLFCFCFHKNSFHFNKNWFSFSFNVLISCKTKTTKTTEFIKKKILFPFFSLFKLNSITKPTDRLLQYFLVVWLEK